MHHMDRLAACAVAGRVAPCLSVVGLRIKVLRHHLPPSFIGRLRDDDRADPDVLAHLEVSTLQAECVIETPTPVQRQDGAGLLPPGHAHPGWTTVQLLCYAATPHCRESALMCVHLQLQAEAAYAKAVLADTEGLQEQLYREMRGRIQEADQSAPLRRVL